MSCPYTRISSLSASHDSISYSGQIGSKSSSKAHETFQLAQLKFGTCIGD